VGLRQEVSDEKEELMIRRYIEVDIRVPEEVGV